MAALISALAAVAGVLLGFFGLPAVVNSPTARRPEPTVPVATTPPSPTEDASTSPPAEPETTKPKLPPLPSDTVPLSDLDPLVGGDDIQIQSVTMGNKLYEKALVFTTVCSSTVEYSINQRYRSLSFTVGMDDNATAVNMKFTIEGDGRARKVVGAEVNRPQDVEVDVTGVTRLGIEVEQAGGCEIVGGLAPAWANATLHS
ncbi:NPCBM/NEW2 domain-containing protein [Streptomyces californicus]|uniref:NPCBM/NEW2 domain-containing protein n=1 Tax=Streptomyces californicus TaxID=67351 RepID=UPI00379426BF